MGLVWHRLYAFLLAAVGNIVKLIVVITAFASFLSITAGRSTRIAVVAGAIIQTLSTVGGYMLIGTALQLALLSAGIKNMSLVAICAIMISTAADSLRCITVVAVAVFQTCCPIRGSVILIRAFQLALLGARVQLVAFITPFTLMSTVAQRIFDLISVVAEAILEALEAVR